MSQKKVTFSCLHAYSTVSNRFNRFFFQDSHTLTPDGRAVLVAILVLWKRPVPIVSDMYLSDIVSGFSILSVDTRFSTCGEWGRHSSWPHLHWWWEITTFNLVFTLLPHHPISTMHSLFPHLSNWVSLNSCSAIAAVMSLVLIVSVIGLFCSSSTATYAGGWHTHLV